jgi:hypothetical protein
VHLFLNWFDDVFYRDMNERLMRSKRHRRMIKEVFAILGLRWRTGNNRSGDEARLRCHKVNAQISGHSIRIVNKQRPG